MDWFTDAPSINTVGMANSFLEFGDLQKSWTPWLVMKQKAPYKDITEEFIAVQDQIVNHRASYGEGWKSLTIHGYRSDWTENINQYEGFKHIESERDANYHWTEIADTCPKTRSFLESLPYDQFFRVRFMLLEPGGIIKPHRDVNRPNLSPLNIAIIHPDGVDFEMKHPETKESFGKVPFEPGACICVNIGTEHAVINRSSFPRVHIIVHGQFTKHFYTNFKDYFE